jgi:hypothetical protein
MAVEAIQFRVTSRQIKAYNISLREFLPRFTIESTKTEAGDRARGRRHLC